MSLSGVAKEDLLRPLSGYERFLWTFNQVKPINFSVVASFEGGLDPARWTTAFDEVQRKHPLLDASIGLDVSREPVFLSGTGSSIPLQVKERTSIFQWERELERELSEPFELSSAPLVRAVLLEDNQQCDLIITLHHSITDGTGALLVLRDLLQALTGEILSPLPLPPSAEERLKAITDSTPHSAKPEKAPEEEAEAGQVRTARTFAYHHDPGQPQVESLNFSSEETSLILRCVHREQTTVGALLLAALASALRKLSPVLRETDLHLHVPVDARPYLNNEHDVVLSISASQALSTHPDGELWESARKLQSDLASSQSLAGIEDIYARIGAADKMPMKAEDLVDAMVRSDGYDLHLSNLKTVDLPETASGLRVKAIWGPAVLMGIEGEQSIGAVTFDAVMRLINTSFTPAKGLLGAARQIILDACKVGPSREVIAGSPSN